MTYSHILLWLVSTFLVGCARPVFQVSPTSLEFGEVDFQQEVPVSGFNPQSVTITNTGETVVAPAVTGFDDTRLVLDGLFESTDPPTVFPLDPGASITVQVAVVSYALGERDTAVNGQFRMSADDAEPVEVDWTFVPVRRFDTGE